VFIVSANDQVEIRNNAMEADVNDFIYKPVDKADFIARVRNILSLHRIHREIEHILIFCRKNKQHKLYILYMGG